MYTQCPDCSAVYEISTEELGAASGLVRCGSCDATFSALRRLSATPPTPPREPEPTPDQAELNFASADSDATSDVQQRGLEVTANGNQDNGFAALAGSDGAASEDAEQASASGRTTETAENATSGASDDPDPADVREEAGGTESRVGTPDSEASSSFADAATTRIAAEEAYEERADLVDEFIDDIDELADFPPGDGADEERARAGDDTRTMREEQHDRVDDGASAETGTPTDPSAQAADAETQHINDAHGGPAGSDGDQAAQEEEAGASEVTTAFEAAETNDAVEPADTIAAIDVIEDWDTDEGEHDIEALLADDALMEEDLVDAVIDVAEQPPAADDAGIESAAGGAANAATGEHDVLNDGAVALDASDDNDDTDEELSGPDDRDETGADDATGHARDAVATDDGEEVDANQRSSMPGDSEASEESGEVRDSDGAGLVAEGDRAPADAEPKDAGEDSGHILTKGVDGTMQPDLDDEHDYRDLRHYLKPGKSFLRKLGEASLLVLLLAVLGVQIVHHNRALLATHPEYGAYVQSAYRSLGLHLDVAWDTGDYRIARHTVVPDKDNTAKLMARATIVNNSAHRRPLPLVRLELRNRWGDAIFARVFAASDYLRSPAPSDLAGGGRLEVALDIRNPTEDAEIGYSFDVCLAGPGGAPNCGNTPIFSKKQP